jgi:hypothetical protein
MLGLLLLAVAIFAKAIFSTRVFWLRDVHLYWYPQVESFVRVVSGGAPPLWNPFFSFGLPLLPDPCYQVLYPFTWLNLLMVPATYYKVYVLVHEVAAGGGLYLLARRWGLSRPAAFVSGAVWMASGPLLVVVIHTHHFAGTALMPWVLLALEAALASGTVGAAMLLGAAAALQVFAGSGDLCLMTAFISGGRILVFLCCEGGAFSRRLRTLAVVTSVGSIFGLALSAAQWLPTVAILGSGHRLELGSAGNLYWSLHPASLPDLFVYRLVADLPVNMNVRAALYESREPLFGCLYLGAAATVLVGVGLSGPWTRFKVLSAAGLVFSVLAALGRHTAFYPALLKTTPLFLFRYPSKYIIAMGFFWAALAGLGAEEWLRPSETPALRRFGPALVFAGVLAALALAGVAWVSRGPQLLLRALEANEIAAAAASWNSSLTLTATAVLASLAGILVWLRARSAGATRWAGPALVALVIGDLAWHGEKVNGLAPPELMNYQPEVSRRIPAGARVYPLPRMSDESWSPRSVVRGPKGWDWRWKWALALHEVLWQPTGARWGLAGSYAGDFTGLAPPLVSNLAMILEGAPGKPLGLRLLQMGGVEYVVSLDPWPDLEFVDEFPSVFDSPVRLFRVPNTLPRAYVVGRARLASEPESVHLIGNPDFEPRREVILPAGTAATGPDPTFRGEARVLWRRADGLDIATTTSSAGYVVVLETFAPGWTATVDRKPAEILRANVIFRAVAVPEGEHVVTLTYRPPSVVRGLVVSGASVVFGLGLWALRSRGRFGLHGVTAVDGAGATL